MKPSQEYLEHYLKFSSGGHHLLIKVENVHSIVEIPEIKTVAQTPNYISGVIVIEGESVPLMDTSLRLNLNPSKASIRPKIIVAVPSYKEDQNEYHPIAFTTEEIDDVIALSLEGLQPLPTEKEEYDNRLFDGVFNVDQKLMMAINIDNFYKEDFDEILRRTNNKRNN